jgi:hypothetical protein
MGKTDDVDLDLSALMVSLDWTSLVHKASKVAGIPDEKGMRFAIAMTALLKGYRRKKKIQESKKPIVEPPPWVM